MSREIIAFIFLFFGLWLGMAFVKWDAIHGAEVGERWGKNVRCFVETLVQKTG